MLEREGDAQGFYKTKEMPAPYYEVILKPETKREIMYYLNKKNYGYPRDRNWSIKNDLIALYIAKSAPYKILVYQFSNQLGISKSRLLKRVKEYEDLLKKGIDPKGQVSFLCKKYRNLSAGEIFKLSLEI